VAQALYIHWPFCEKKCPYCDFNSHVRNVVDVDAWQAALLADMRAEAVLASGDPLTSIFFGGGTPSLMPTRLVAALLDQAEALWGFDPAIEITLEANPSSVEAANFASLASAGVNRVSLGIQSLDDEALQWLGRLHGSSEALAALDTAQRAFERVSFDLIYALPNQTLDQWQCALDRALAFGTSHLSLYQLTIEPGTRFATDVRLGKFEPLDDDVSAELYAMTLECTQAVGLPVYEISNFARLGQESRHNLTYWRYQDYCGIGPGAHGRREGFATVRHKKPENYIQCVSEKRHGIAEQRMLQAHDQAIEALLMGLRLAEGIDSKQLAKRFGLAEQDMLDFNAIDRLEKIGLVWKAATRIGATAKGFPVLNSLTEALVHDHLLSP